MSGEWLDRLSRLRQRVDLLRRRLSRQVQLLPSGNDSWLETERELCAAESALNQLADDAI
ncbi:hypothetical protein EVJ50_06280 [Synechococcus sp. RSCCF101]|nr:hypothetical protein EVJ50_06280 [Synechococcus sp. RSCCF101]